MPKFWCINIINKKGVDLPANMPFLLIVATTILIGFVNTHQRHWKYFNGASKNYELALSISTLLGLMAIFTMLVFYGYQTSWYLPVILFVISSIFAGIFFGILDATVGLLILSPVGFIAWPAAATCMYFIASGLRP